MIYLDYAASAPVHPEVFGEMLPWLLGKNAGNPGSIHSAGRSARAAIQKAAWQVAELIGAEPEQIIFTSGATESNNLWLYGVAGHVITTALEHPSVLESVKKHNGGWMEYLKTDTSGSVILSDLQQHLLHLPLNVHAVSAMYVNNELGTVNPIEEIGKLCRNNNILFHTDATQAVGHIPVDVDRIQADFLSLSAHKFGGPQGTGALYVRRPEELNPMFFGGGQQNGLRSGTENVAGIVGLGAAAAVAKRNMEHNLRQIKRLRTAFLQFLTGVVPGRFTVNGGDDHIGILSLTFPGIHAESLLMAMDSEGVCISAGSACHADKTEESHVLLGVGISSLTASSTVRISFGPDTTLEALAYAAKSIHRCITLLDNMNK